MKTVEYYMNLDYEIIVKKLDENEGGGWFAYYSDIKGVMGDGDTPAEAIDEARLALKAYIDIALKCGDNIRLPKEKDKTVRINITISKTLLERVDTYAHNAHINRSRLISEALASQIA